MSAEPLSLSRVFQTPLRSIRSAALLGNSSPDRTIRQETSEESCARVQQLGEQRVEAAHKAFQNLQSNRSPYDDISGNSRPRVRLLRLQASGADRLNDFELRTFPLKQSPKYYALSYAWATYVRDCAIQCNGKPLKISAHLLRGLNELESISDFAHKWFWIDQICINQENLKERSHQVRLMRRIYQRAELTVIWLGLNLKPYDEAAQLSQHLYDKKSELEDGQIRLPLRGDASWEQLAEVCSSSWFSRLWTLQEVFLSRKDPKVVYGARVGQLSVLLWAIGILGNKRFESPSGWTLMVDIRPGRNHFGMCTDALSLLCSYPQQFRMTHCDFATALLLARGHGASDGRDQIYGLQGLVQPPRDKDTEWPSALIPDYEKPVVQVYRDATLHIISQTGNLLPWSLVDWGWQGFKDSWPSWVPEYSNAVSMRISDVQLRIDKGSLALQRSRIRASKDRRASIRPSLDANLIIIQGLKLSTVKSTFEVDTKNPASFFHRLEEINECARSANSDNTFNKVFDDIADVFNVRAPLCRIHDFWEYISNEGQNVPNLIYFLRFLKDFDDDVTGNEEVFIEKFLITMRDKSYSNFFVDSGGDVGLGPMNMEVGDVICVLFGGAGLYVLRPVGGDSGLYRLLSECRIRRYMCGESIDALEYGVFKEEWFTIA
ncbi:heterokaryon incompatibility protein-domain-containing protein [Lasiosphaeria miniovina]|uniref:Heterokaryon incompatibility protein-domain-containing protein n=1 Tax=Lasiosphaeria miniovina TaxID=1954250 RepID=A0AA40DI20_9PEZI|nr:heterokaryon incompatibility protein-domain-containing protein [Lasiosphaeria miniovina]KAK0702096.1 heterokaryon incompatibility protein-domain-containing protein [Lasiosphaeria miniovina]